jgi:hypothetical protein
LLILTGTNLLILIRLELKLYKVSLMRSQKMFDR